jgi:hypothetical protein
MVDLIFLYWIIIFVVLLAVNIGINSTTFGMVAGFWLMILGLAVVITGLQLQTGSDMTSTGITYLYEDALLPFSTYAYIWGIFFVVLSIYIVYANAEKRFG